jgi:hypothetical protein
VKILLSHSEDLLMRKFSGLLVLGLGLIYSSGCSDPYAGRNEVFGKVTFKGQPVESGTISFVPMDANSPTPGSAMITKGEYKILRQNGLLAGKYRVSVSSPDGKTPANDPNAEPGPTGNFASKERIPAKYNTESREEFEVKAGQKNEFNLAIP